MNAILSSKPHSFLEAARNYNALTKPGIIRLLVLTTVCTMLVAEKGIPSFGLMFWTVLGTALVSGSANTFKIGRAHV